MEKYIYKYYINDILSIHVRSFFCVIVNLVELDLEVALLIIGFLLFTKLYSLYFFYNDILDNIYSNVVITYASKDRVIDYLVKFPILLECLLTIFHSKSLVASNHNIISIVGIFLLLKIQPFYEYNHFVLHLLLLYQSYGLSACNNSLLQ